LDKHEDLLSKQAIYYRFRGICHENLKNPKQAIAAYESAQNLAETQSEKEWAQNRIKTIKEGP
ncbi:MAG: hypothetical protein HKN00_00825, partial [Flavobacteriaceae bacterium]|nr:hypothetical protein [Flavobacteriaceae bacterium]